MKKTLYIETLGCQMNVLDSELIVSGLLEKGYELVDTPRLADVVLFNTCSVRQHAEDKVYSALGRLKHAKKYNPLKIIGVIGCMAQKDQALILRRAPHVDLVVGPSRLAELPELLDLVAAGDTPKIAVSLDRYTAGEQRSRESFVPFNPDRLVEAREAPHQAMVRAIYGCNNFCTYCIVPSVRGPEQSRPIDEIDAEVRRLAEQAERQGTCLEVTLLGQAVNKYEYKEDGKTYRLSDVLHRVHDAPGLTRLKFVTNYPRYMTDDLLHAVHDLPKVSPYLHAPAQSGSDRMLQRMNRRYTIAEYRDMLRRIHEIVPDAAVTSDFIVGFCGETDDDFQATVDLVREARFKNSFIFKYSPRPGTNAATELEDDVPEEVKRQRNNELLAIQNAISEEDNRQFVGRTVEILVEGPSKASIKQDHSDEGDASKQNQMTGRTVCDRIVVFDGPRELTGRLVNVTIENAASFTLFGRLL
ncbi:MAG: tRNA (N6-isopentenyl adenosine(37)-C2)-methylthiotransferase MiaB [Planctomycetia bacterium]|jgi:tRNA-2-methylthio-N6-dimethylallyladenosine synthase